MLERIQCNGTAPERGEQYGTQAAARIARCLEVYREAFAHYAGWDWAQVREHAARFRKPIAAFDGEYLAEIDGIARGAGVDGDDVLALNVRTEVMFAAIARDATGAQRLPPECSAITVTPARARDRRLLSAQNWDWLSGAADTLVLLEVSQPDRPDYVTVVEAGLLAKVGLNAAGIALTTNALVCESDRGEPGVPYHVLLRAILDAETASDALVSLARARRASSGNYIVAQDSVVLDIEAAPGGLGRLFVAEPEDGVLLHTNHFTHPRADVVDVAFQAMPDSPFRLARLRQLVTGRSELDIDSVLAMLSDHEMFPLGVCCHPDPRSAQGPAYQTVATIAIEPSTATIWIADGTPCAAPLERIDYRDRLIKRSSPAGAFAAP